MMLLRRLVKAPLRGALAVAAIRRRAIFELRQHYYGDLDLGVPLGHDLTCPLAFADAWSSFAEVFVRDSYGAALDRLGLPDRWLDLGCHAGYFSLYVVWRRALAGCRGAGSALLLDADSRVEEPVKQLIAQNSLATALRFAHGAIGTGQGIRKFRERSFMSSSVADLGDRDGRITAVPVITAADLLRQFPSPYDLVKVDIEGGEYEFAESYHDVITEAAALLVECHGGDHKGRGRSWLSDELGRRGFESMDAGSPARHPDPTHGGPDELVLFTRRR